MVLSSRHGEVELASPVTYRFFCKNMAMLKRRVAIHTVVTSQLPNRSEKKTTVFKQ